MYESFRQALLESSVKTILKREFPEIRFHMTENSDFITLDIIVVQYKERKQGKANEFMRRLIELAKQEQKDIFLTPDDSYAEKNGMNKSKLTKWYKKLGFKPKEKSDFRSRNLMCYYSKPWI